MTITQQQRQDLTLAVVAGEHQIDADCIRLHRDPTQEGSALSQLVDRVVAVIEQSTAQPQAVVPAPSGAGELIAGALFDLMGMLTSQDEVCTFSSRHDAGPAVEQLRKFAENRGLSLEPCDVAGWSKRISAQPSAQPSQAPVVQAVQAREYPPLPWGNQQPYVWFCRTKDTDLVAAFRAYVDADRASTVASLTAQRDAALARVAELEKDAARYRWLRDCNSGSLVVVQITGTGEDDWYVLTEDDADAAIDAAITARRKT